jgi:flagellar hook-associated protein 1 FlgK
MRQSVSGVNIDEELTNMIKYQHGYSAAARFITTMNTSFPVLPSLQWVLGLFLPG